MILPIYLYGQPVLRKEAQEITKDFPGLNELIENMFATMYHSNGVGLAGPQIGKSIRLFVVDGSPMAEELPELANTKKVFINPEIVEFSEQESIMEEGCLSLPNLHEKVARSFSIKVNYFDENWVEHKEEEFKGFFARMIQHEYEHLQGHVFTDNINPLRRQMISNKLSKIAKGKVRCDYKVK